MEGYLEKWSRKTKEFAKRYVVISPVHKQLLYYDNDDISKYNQPRGKLKLDKAIINVEDTTDLVFSISNEGKYLRFKANDIPHRNYWVSKLSELVCFSKDCNDAMEFSNTKECLEFVRDAHNKLSTSLQSLSFTDVENTQNLNKFGEQIAMIKESLEELKYLTDSEHEISDLENEEGEDDFLDCEPPIIESSPSSMCDVVAGDFSPEDDFDEGEIPVNSSIVRHLVSQVKIGMDLSKVTLPTFILERRSLLEMFGDFFSRPTILLNAAAKKDPRERFIGVVQHYLGSFYPGRRLKVSKKPYNPILGEIFRCFYQCMPNRDKYPDNLNGPIPWAKECDLSFIAEQVSHHPPISAFYAECPSAKISCNAYIYTKSRFLGASVGVHNVGKGVITLHEYNEEYEFDFPSGYARSIFTVPWFELGGNCTLSCKKTGYTATVEFIPKPFLGGKKHKINVEILESNSKKPISQISGEWNGIMVIQNPKEEVKHIFIDTHHEPIHKKCVKLISQQDSNESRVIWQHVTEALKIKDIDKASAEKHKIEENQREIRKTLTEVWKPVYFDRMVENEFLFKNQLKNRLPKAS